MRNAERLRELAGFIGGLEPEQLNMSAFTSECGTSCCIGGWAVEYFDDGTKPNEAVYESAYRMLGLTRQEADDLFIPTFSWAWDKVECTPKRVAAVLEFVADGEEVIDAWKKAFADLPKHPEDS